MLEISRNKQPLQPQKQRNVLGFSGYRLTPSNEARLFLPGYSLTPSDSADETQNISRHGQDVDHFQTLETASAEGKQRASQHASPSHIEAEVILPGQQNPQPMPLDRWGDYWISRQTVPLGTNYRFLVDGAPRLDALETVHPLADKSQTFNRVSPFEAMSPRKSSVIADIYLDSLLSTEQFDQTLRDHGGLLPVRDHFKLFGGNEAGLFQLMSPRKDSGISPIKEAGFTGMLFKPFIGGDNLSSHRYWTVDPYILNNSFSSQSAFRKFLRAALVNDLKIFADGAFVNQGFNGVQKMANIAHGFRSPYWNWFTYNETPEGAGPLSFPKHAFEKESWGILPVLADETGSLRVAHERYALRVINDPDKPGYDPRDYTFVETYDPNTQTAEGQPLKPPYEIRSSRDSIQTLRIPVSIEELQEKRPLLYRSAARMSDAERAKLCEWGNIEKDGGGVRLVADFKDDSGFKWDGQVDVAKMNMRNPEVVKYSEGAVTYWTRTVTNSYIDAVTKALKNAQQSDPHAHPLALVRAVTQQPGDSPSELKVLPPVTYPELENLSRDEAEKVLQGLQECEPDETARKLAGHMLDAYPLSALELPVMFKATLAHPDLPGALKADGRSAPGKLLDRLLGLLAKIPLLGKGFAWMQNRISPFETLLAGKMDQLLESLSPEALEKLRDDRIQSLLAEKLAERLYMKILTNLDDPDKAVRDAMDNRPEIVTLPPNQREAEVRKIRERTIQKAFLDTIPQGIYRNDPETAAMLLPRFMKQRLQSIKPGMLVQMLERELSGLDPKLAALAEALVQKREFGLNWRLDAAKDVANMDVVKNTAPAERAEVFLQEIDFVHAFWRQISSSIHGIFKKASIIAEFTDFFPFSGDNPQTVREATEKLCSDDTFNGIVNWEYAYKPLHQLVHHNQRPDEISGTGTTQMWPSEFLHRLTAMSEELPFPVVRQYQNLSSCHDQITSSQGLLTNPAITFMDLVKWWGLKEDLNEVCNELKSKVCFEETREAIGVTDLDSVLGKLLEQVQSPAVKEKLSPEVQDYFDNPTKGERKGDLSEPPATPAELKPRFVDEIFKAIAPETLDITPAQHEALRDALKARISEPSEARGMRAVIVNAMNAFPWDDMPQTQVLNADQRAQFSRAFWKALDKTITQQGRHFGYQPLDIGLTRVFQNLAQEPALPKPAQNKLFLEALKLKLYEQANQPLMEKLLRIFAIQTAMPGNASIYLQDFFARGGGEWTKNIFVQNRNLLPIQRLYEDPASDFRKFHAEAGRIFGARSASVRPDSALTVQGINPETKSLSREAQGSALEGTGISLTAKGFDSEAAKALRQSCAQALNDGVVLPTLPANPTEGQSDPNFDRIKQSIDESGVMPIVRDNGRDQVIVLVNTGSPQNRRDDYNDRIGSAPTYKDILPEKPLVTDHKPDLSHLHLAPGTRYIDVYTGEAFRLNSQGLLVNEQDSAKGVDVHISRFLVRENKHPSPPPDALPPEAYMPSTENSVSSSHTT